MTECDEEMVEQSAEEESLLASAPIKKTSGLTIDSSSC